MKVVHWALLNNSGMARTAQAQASGEQAAGIDAVLLDPTNGEQREQADGADIHVVHTHAPHYVIHGSKPLVWVAHGTPEVMFHSGYEQGTVNGAYGHADAWMQAQFWLQHADATVTYWPRHQAIWQSLADKRSIVDLHPMGVDRSFWTPTATAGKYAGSPSVFTAENCYEIKWPLDLFLAWPWVIKDVPDARLHAIYLPRDQHRWWFPLVNRNGTSFYSHLSPQVFNDAGLRNAFCSSDYYVSFVRYGDASRASLEASASGAKVISYRGNPYATYWVTEGDQRILALELAAILSGRTEPRVPEAVPSHADMVAAAVQLYGRL